MEHFRIYGMMLALLVLSSVSCRAEDSICTQAINTMYKDGTLVTVSPYKVGTTDLVTYTCYGNAKFGSAGGGVVALLLPDKNDSVVTSRITNLKQVKISYTNSSGSTVDYLSELDRSMQIKVSEDSLVWTNLTAGATHSSGIATVQIPDPGDYYISVRNTKGSKPIYIRTFEYTTQQCNCFQYHP